MTNLNTNLLISCLPCHRRDIFCDKVLHNINGSMQTGIQQQSWTLSLPKFLPRLQLMIFNLLLIQVFIMYSLLSLLSTFLECIQHATQVQGNSRHKRLAIYIYIYIYIYVYHITIVTANLHVYVLVTTP